MSEASSATILSFRRRTGSGCPLEAEAARRLASIGYDEWARRATMTGARIPARIQHLKLQIEFAAAALKSLDPLPEDFRSDGFWPS